MSVIDRVERGELALDYVMSGTKPIWQKETAEILRSAKIGKAAEKYIKDFASIAPVKREIREIIDFIPCKALLYSEYSEMCCGCQLCNICQLLAGTKGR